MGERGLIFPILASLLAGLAVAGGAESQGWCENRQQPLPVRAGELSAVRPQPRNDDPTVREGGERRDTELLALISPSYL